jgi:DNA-binding NarL/FixJ family response regulator
VANRVTSVFVVSGVRLYRDGICRLLEHGRDIRVAGVAASHRAAVPALLARPVDVILLDTTLPDADDALRELGAPDQKVVVLGVVEREEDVIGWAEKGAAGYVSRDGSSDDLTATIRTVARDGTLFPPQMVAALLRRLAARAAASTRAANAPGELLTPRERQVADLIGEGLSNKEIAQRLCIELPTVKNHVHNILRKLECSRRGQAAAQMLSAR